MRLQHKAGIVFSLAAATLLAAVTWGLNSDKDQPSFQLSRTEAGYTLEAKDARLTDILAELQRLGAATFKVDPKLQMRVTASLRDAPIEKVLETLTRSRAMVYEKKADQVQLAEVQVTSEQAPMPAPEPRRAITVKRAPFNLRPGVLSNSDRPLEDLRGRDAKAILLENAVIDTWAMVEEGTPLDVPTRFKAPDSTEYYIVQFSHALSDADRKALEALGATVSHYVPNRSYAIRISPSQLDALKAVPGVYAVQAYHPYFKMSPAVRDYLLGSATPAEVALMTNNTFNLMTFGGADVRGSVEAAGAKVTQVQTVGARTVLTVKADPSLLEQMVDTEGVQWVEPKVYNRPMNDLGVKRMRVPSLRALHPTLTGAGVIVGVTDTGVDFVHPGFSDVQGSPTTTGSNTRIAYYEARPGPLTEGLPGDIDGHGSHVSGSILGNGALSDTVVSSPGSDGPPYGTNQFAGVAPRAKLVMIEDFNSFSYADQAQIMYQKGARISNNSWGADVFEYTADSAVWDGLVRDADGTTAGNQELITFFAAGNAGGGEDNGLGATANTVGTPGNAKNVITMGAVEQPRHANNLMDVFFGTEHYFSENHSDSDWQMAAFSSRGPVTPTDLRVKPDLVAPGEFVLSIQSHETDPDEYASGFHRTDYRFGNVDSGTNYAFFSGTSMATPLGAGAAALMYQYLTNTLSAPPSPALMKAAMVAGARPVNTLVYKHPLFSDQLDIVQDGWGMIDVARSVDGPRIRSSDFVLLLDQNQTTPLQTGETYSRQVLVGANEGGLKIVLAWTDVAGTPGNDIQLVNDLDLVVFAPNGVIYRGNQFDTDGVHAFPFASQDPALHDQYNNVEAVTIPGGAGTYTIRVNGTEVPQGPQDFALAIQKGVGFQGRTEGNNPAIALDASGSPVLAYSLDTSTEGNFSNLTRQIFVKRWVGSFGDRAELGQWKRLEDQWYEIRDSMHFGGISKTVENSEFPSVAVRGDNVYVAWQEGFQTAVGAITNSRVFLRQYDGSVWKELGGSGHSRGLSQNLNYDARLPVVRVMGDGSPVVAWLQDGPTTDVTRVFLARWNGTNWVGLAGSNTNGLPTPASIRIAEDMSMTINSAGNPVVAWHEQTNPDGIVVLQWSGAVWSNISPSDSPPFVDKPKVAAGPNGSLFVSWVQTYGSNPGIYQSYQVFALRYTGSGWTNMGNSITFPGISTATNASERPIKLDLAAAFNTNVTVVWQGGASNGVNSILSRRWYTGATNWVGVSGSETPPGVTRYQENFERPAVVVDQAGIPVMTFLNTVATTNVQEVLTYAFVGDRDPPVFAGLQNAIGGTNGNVFLSWQAAVDDLSSNILYRIYRGTQTFACGTSPSCNESNVFANLIAIVTNTTAFQVTNLTPNQSYCFGVRSADTNGLVDGNSVVRSAGPVTGAGDNDGDCLINGLEVSAGTEPCLQDTDGDGMIDGWEWTYSTNNPAHPSYTNAAALHMDPLDSGLDKVRTTAVGDGDKTQLPGADLDGDGASNYEEYQWWLQHTFATSVCEAGSPTSRISPDPTKADTDGDGMPDGFEIFSDLNPTVNDAAGDADGDGVSNILEYQYGGDPQTADSDGDGLSDSNEFYNTKTFLNVADSDQDGLDDGVEVQLGSNPRKADSNGSFLSDGAVYQLGLSPTGTAVNFNMLLSETFETNSPTRGGWSHYAANAFLPKDMWHLSTTEPDTNSFTNIVAITYFNTRTSNTAYRAANDVAGTNLNANYSGFGSLAMALQAPTLTNSAAVSNLFVSWLEWYETEPNADFATLQVRSSGNTNWFYVGTTASGKSGVTNLNSNQQSIWVRRTADLSRYAGQSNVQIRFLFTANNINNQFKGWWVDDVRVYEAVTIRGWVRDINGAAIEGAVVQAMGRGGVTNVVDGNRYVRPGLILADATTAKDGSYAMTGLPAGNYYVKAQSSTYRAEFYDGPLFTGAYAFGAGLRPGVMTRDGVSTNGIVQLLTPGQSADVYFELEKGGSRGCVGVALAAGAGAARDVLLNSQPARIWNGTNSVATASLTNYMAATSLDALADNHVDWLTNAAKPSLLCDLSAGLHRPLAGTNLVFFALPEVLTRDGEITLVEIHTNYSQGSLFVNSEDGASYAIRLDGRPTTNRTPASIRVKAGLHEVFIGNTGATSRIAPKRTTVPIDGRAVVTFTSNDVGAAAGTLNISAVDINGNAVTNLTVYVNGSPVTTNDVLTAGRGPGTPVGLAFLRPGTHEISVDGQGYKRSEVRNVAVFSGVTNDQVFIAYQADVDNDKVGDATEVAAYTNIFLYHRDDDPDGDQLNNLQEFDLVRLFNAKVSPFNADSDGDGLADGLELAYGGFSNRYALSVLDTNAVQFAPTVRVRFVGRYLEGIDNFGTTSTAVSIEGDRFVGALTHPNLTVPTANPALTVFTAIPTFPSNLAVNVGHNAGAVVFADGRPDVADTDGDGMWDGFEASNGLATIAQLDVIEAGRASEDPDEDGLNNYNEFIGTNGLPDLFDFTSPILADTDGDFLPDGWEYSYHFNPNDSADAFDDPDGDGLVNLGEYLAGTDPRQSDTDADGLPDFEEVVIYHTDPLDIDTDNDGLLDGREVWDKDMDGIRDGGFFPNWAGGDMDNDGYIDGPTDWDTDGDGMPDGFEVLDAFGKIRPTQLNPFDPTDGDEDSDGDGLSNYQEFLIRDGLYGNNPSVFGGAGVLWDYSTDPFKADSDGDGLPDGFEATYGLHPMDPVPCGAGGLTTCTRYSALGPAGDNDSDGLWNLREYNIRFHLNPSATSNAIADMSTHPWNPDTDRDGLGDGEEDRGFGSNPIRQDTDDDRLADGVAIPDKWGEVESVHRLSEYAIVPCGSCTWTDLYAASAFPHFIYPNITSHLAVLHDAGEGSIVTNVIGFTNLAIGAINNAGDRLLGWSWVNNAGFTIENIAALNTNASTFQAGQVNYLTANSQGVFTPVTTQILDGALIEWDEVPQADNHFDQATNDLWRLVWPSIPNDIHVNLPVWERVTPVNTGEYPLPRWGAGVTYVPPFETKNPRDDATIPGATILLDNRKLVVIGGRDGVTKMRDVWEYIIRSNMWVRSIAPLYGSPQYLSLDTGLSDLAAVPLFVSKNTRPNASCKCDSDLPWDCDGTEFLEPKNRPYSDSRSFDWTYIFGGWDNSNAYFGNSLLAPGPASSSQGGAFSFYHSTDSKVVDETLTDSAEGTELLHIRFSISGTNTVGVTNIAVDTANDDGNLIDYNRRILGGPFQRVQTALEGDASIIETNTYLGTNGFFFTGLNGLGGPCEQIYEVKLEFPVAAAASQPVELALVSEFDSDVGDGMGDYTVNPPSKRLGANWQFKSSPIFTNTPPSVPADGVITVDVTSIAFEAFAAANYDRTRLGFVVYTPNLTGAFVQVKEKQTRLRVRYRPSYAVDPFWSGPGTIHNVYTRHSASKRKSTGMVYDYNRQKLILFGGIDGNEVLGDTHEGEITYNAGKEPTDITWAEVAVDSGPPARWGHSMVYDAKNARVVLFGGFDSEHRPLNDLWVYEQTTSSSDTTNAEGSNVTVVVTNAATWRQITSFQDTQRPQPRAGASMVFFGDFDYSRGIEEYCVSGNKEKIVLFGGTDGKSYYNDTWVFDDTQDRWLLVYPNGEQSQGPSPRAFASMVWAQNGRVSPEAKGATEYRSRAEDNAVDGDDPNPKCARPAVYLFGGRTGTLPRGQDTDNDLVDDGAEYELGGTAAGRDPRINALINPNFIVVSNMVGTNVVFTTNMIETVPFNFRRIGSRPASTVRNRGAIATFESLRHDEGGFATGAGVPYETHPDARSQINWTTPFTGDVGVDATKPDETNLWYHRFGGENPFDARDVWQVGVPGSTTLSSNAAPPYAYSGRWVYGTELSGNYPNNSISELYSPIFNLDVPSSNSTTFVNNGNSFFLVFQEWLDLADANDSVRIDAVRPQTPADIANRLTGLTRPVKPVLPSRNNLYNSGGQWRRTIVPLDILGNESNLYLRFTLQSDSNNVAGGWYIDDVAILQGAEINGQLLSPLSTNVCITGENFNDHYHQCTSSDTNGAFKFGLLPLGNYQIVSMGLTNGPYALTGPDLNVTLTEIAPPDFQLIASAVTNGVIPPVLVTWSASSGYVYKLDYATNLLTGAWNFLTLITGGPASTLSYTDAVSTADRIYRVSITNAP